MTVYPNVKLNLGLNVLGKRPDGYHELRTAFIPCYAFSDCLEIVPSASFEVEISGPEYTGWDPSEDLTARAWRLLRADFGIPPVKICLEKRSPVGAGLGGGSADGAFALAALNEMFSLGLSLPKLAEYAALLGSDCAFFIYNFPMYASGRGEILEPLELALDGYRFEVAVPPGIHVSTREAYEGLKVGAVGGVPSGERATLGIVRGGTVSDGGVERSETSPEGSPSAEPEGALPPAELRDVLLSTPVERWKDLVVNDFEASVFPKYPAIEELKADFYRRGAVYASMSGSGSSVFGIFRIA